MDYGVLLGKGMKHSMSPLLHSCFGKYEYGTIDLSADEIEPFFRNFNLKGINVTVPYKKAVIPYLDELSETAEMLGSVNTIVRTSDGKLKGYNTDCYGFTMMVRESGIHVNGKICAVLGNGGAAPAVRTGLLRLGAKKIIQVSGKGPVFYNDFDKYGNCSVIVNATPVGMFPKNDECIVDVRNNFTGLCGVIDLVYNPIETLFVKNALEAGIPAVSGISMLCRQGALSSWLFTGKTVSEKSIQTAQRKLVEAISG